jgi:hypothetical protein
MPGVPGVPLGGVTGGAGVIFLVVSRGSWARAIPLVAQSEKIAVIASTAMRPVRSSTGAELVVLVSLTHERTVYFTL